MEPLKLVLAPQSASTATGVPLCTQCGGESTIHLAHARTDLCGPCFCRRFGERVAKANREFHLVRRGDRIAVAISGGKDSAALLLSLHALSQRIGEVTLLPVLIDEGIEGYRNVAAQGAHSLCERLGLELTVLSYKELFGVRMDRLMAARESGLAIGGDARGAHACSFCGVFRKRALNEAARKLGANKLAVGHNADDIGQTLLMNLLRNETARIGTMEVSHAGKIDSSLVPRIKPLAFCTEMECALFARLSNAPFHRGGCPFAGESFRGRVKDFLNGLENEHPGTKMNLVNASLCLQPLLSRAKRSASGSTCRECGEFASDSSGLCRSCALLASGRE